MIAPSSRTRVPGAAVLTLLVLASAAGGQAADAWPRWGGPHGNFMTDATGLAESWPAEGPPQLWRRPLGEGHASILARDGVLYTHYRTGDDEVVIALGADDGATIWEHPYEAATGEDWRLDYGAGPHASPVLDGERIFAVGMTGILHALRTTDGTVLWSRDLVKGMEGTLRALGYSASPIVYGDSVIVPVGGEGKMVVAFDQADGSVRWRGGDDENSFSTPTLIEIGGTQQLVFWGAEEIVGLDPSTGKQLWQHPHPTHNAFNISTPLFWDDGLLFVSSAYDGGGRVLKLIYEGGETEVEELWFSNQMRIHFGTAIRLGEVLYASSGDFGPAPMTAIDVWTGDILWRDRSFAKHSIVYADGKLVLLDEDGALGLVRVSPKGMEVLARAQVFDSRSWTVPTLVGTKLYLRNREEIVALDLGVSE